jgi:hypothetical protein
VTSTRRVPCGICGRESLPGRGVCSRCNRGADRPRGSCVDCARPDLLLDSQRRCRKCRSRANRRCADCDRVTINLVGIEGVWACGRCALKRRVDQIIPTQPAGALIDLRPALLAADPLTTRMWLARSRDLLIDLDQRRIALDHGVLDAMPRHRVAEHLRALLIAADILPPDAAGPLRRFESDLDNLLDELDEPNRKLVNRWVRWEVLARLRRRHDEGRTLTASIGNARRQIHRTVGFLTMLHNRQRTLGSTAQHDIDDWFAVPGHVRWDVRPFLTWARRVRELPRDLVIPSRVVRPSTTPIDGEERWRIAKKLLTDDSIDAADRVAGALVVIYGQPISRIVTLTTAHVAVAEQRVCLRLGHHPLDLPEPLATLIQDLPTRRRDGIAEQLPNTWLFAGSRAGAPLKANSLAIRLQKIGIDPGRMRVAAADQLARELAPAVLAEVLGIGHGTAARAVSRAGGDWANYAADRHQ